MVLENKKKICLVILTISIYTSLGTHKDARGMTPTVQRCLAQGTKVVLETDMTAAG
jgi:hypothetical protein